jgi:lipopolysaccharide/colanic/teichoic acid biosynthesis glycosyltransferase
MILKRVFDVTTSGIGIIVASPVIVALFITMSIDTHSINPIFTQERVGQHGKIFKVYKIKTMKSVNPNNSNITEDNRTSRLGQIIRKARLDELPQLLNIIKGDMSLVGPRPFPPSFYSLINIERQAIRPGLTGLAQTSGFNKLSESQVLEKDLEYMARIKTMNDGARLLYDLSILLRTPSAILRHLDTPHRRILP